MSHFFYIELFSVLHSCFTFSVTFQFLFALPFFHVALFLCCIIFSLSCIFFHVLFSYLAVSMLQFFVLRSFHVALFSYCTILLLHSFHVAFFPCCTIFMLIFSRVAHFYVALFLCCTLFMLHCDAWIFFRTGFCSCSWDEVAACAPRL